MNNLKKKIESMKDEKQKMSMSKLYLFLNKPHPVSLALAGIPIIGEMIMIISLPIIALYNFPFLAKSLIKLKKKNWIIWLCATAVVPLILRQFFPRGGMMGQVTSVIFLFFFVLNFILFCRVLKNNIHDLLIDHGPLFSQDDDNFDDFNDFTTTEDDEINGTYYDGPEPEGDYFDEIEEDEDKDEQDI